MAQYIPPTHNQSIFNPNEFPTTTSTIENLGTLIQINQQVGINNSNLQQNTTLINSYRQLFSTIPSNPSTIYNSGTKYTYALPAVGNTPPLNVPFMVIVNFNLNNAFEGGSINKIVCELYNNGVSQQSQTYNQQGITTTNIAQAPLTTQFVFNGLGNGLVYDIRFTITGIGGVNENANGLFNDGVGLPAVNTIQVLWL
jgi:hypothetical protein